MTRQSSAIDIEALIDSLPATLASLARRGVSRPYRKGTILITEGDRGDTVYIILAGRLRSFSANFAQDREITFGTYGPGEYLGELSLDGGVRSASIMTLEPSVCAVVTRATIEAHIAEHPAFAFDLLAKVISRARAATLSARQMALNDVYGRVKQLLESMAAVPQAPGWCAVQRITHKDMAARAGCSREMVSRVMKDLETGGHVEPDGKGLRIKLPLPARW